MNPEEMRAELEIFVNRGLREGWRGWPRHDGRDFHRTDRMGRTNGICRTGLNLAFAGVSYGSYRSN